MRVLSLLLLFTVACSDGNATFSVRESIEQLHVTHAVPGATIELLDTREMLVASGIADEQGSLVFRRVAPASGYVLRSGLEHSRQLTVMSVASSLPSRDFYSSQRLVPGLNYLKTRDGTTLSANVILPGAPEDGPYPTVVGYSGYAASRPSEGSPQFAFLCDQLPSLCNPPDEPAALLASLYGYATVSVNIRGTGCSGGAYDYFETPQRTDGYDVIEIVAAQPWVMHHTVGMVGLSYPGITQLFVAAERPPSLAAIAPMSVIGNTASTLLPGGILNDGFAISWVKAVLSKAKPFGQGWEQARVDGGDKECAENQLLHSQWVDNVEQARALTFYDPAEHDRFNPTTFVDRIEVPVFLAGAWQDEQTGPFFDTLLDRFTSSPSFRATVYNGVHVDAFQPAIIPEWYAFLELFVARRVPVGNSLVRSLAPLFFDQVFGTPMQLAEDRFTGYADHASAVAAWKAEPPIRALFESGASTSDPGAPLPSFEHSFTAWPPPETRVEKWIFSDGPVSTFDFDPAAGARGNLAPGGNVWDRLPAYDWRAPAPGAAVVFDGDVLTRDRVMIGRAEADLWLRSPVDDADLEVTVTELRPDGQEMYVQSGWLRASLRKSQLASDFAPLVPGEWTQVHLSLAPAAHVFRAGSRIRVAIDTPGDNRAEWRFAVKPFPLGTRYEIAHDATHPSSIAFPFAEGVTPPTARPACPSLRGQPCRPW